VFFFCAAMEPPLDVVRQRLPRRRVARQAAFSGASRATKYQDPGDLRGKRLGARVIGAGLWISTILALEQLALDPQRDDITILPVGNPVQIFRALEQGEIDGALVSTAQSRELQAKG